MMKIKLEGAKELEKKLKELSKKFDDPNKTVKLLKGASKKALKPSESVLRTMTPKDTGQLRNSIKIFNKKVSESQRKKYGNLVLLTSIGYKWKATIKTKDTESDSDSTQKKATKKRNPFYARVLSAEFGSYGRKRGFERPLHRLANTQGASIINSFMQEVSKVIQKEAKKGNK